MAEEKTTRRPIVSRRLGNLSLGVWESENGAVSVKLTRSYRDANGTWARSESLWPSDLPVAIALFQCALDWLLCRDKVNGQVSEE